MRYYETPRDEINYFRVEYEFLSNFYPTKMAYEGVTYHNAEAAYQAQKCAREEDKLQFASLSADEAKRLGQKIDLRPDWDDVKRSVMEKVVYEKFAQNPTLAQDLLDTGDKPLKEGNTWGDVYWGISLRTGKGENHLGKILMTLRSYFRENGIPSSPLSFDLLKGPFDGMYISDIDITLSECDAIVNAANKTLLGGGGVDGAIHRAAGPELKAECATLGGCDVGEAKLTGGYRLKAKHVIHTVGPKYPTENCQEKLAMCYTACLDLAKAHGLHSIEFPSISTGIFSYPKQEACEIAVKTVHTWLKNHADYDMKVVFSCIDPRIYELIDAELTHL